MHAYQDGIYDIISLLDEYPSYASFVEPALATANYADLSCRTWNLRNKTPLYFIHSPNDELLSYAQTYEALKLVEAPRGRMFAVPQYASGACAALLRGSGTPVADICRPVSLPHWVHVDMDTIKVCGC